MDKTILSEFCCNDLFSIKELNGIKLLAGRKNITNKITRVNIMEVPDIDNWVHEHEFLITTAYPFKNDLIKLYELIPKLKKKNVAALGIKTKRFVNEIPQKVIDCAESLDFPLFELPDQTAFSNVVREVMEQIIFGETKYIEILQERIEKVSNSIIQGQTIEEILSMIESLIKNPVFLIGEAKQYVASKTSYEIIEKNESQLDWEHFKILRNQNPIFVEINGEKVVAHIVDLENAQAQALAVVILEINEACTTVDKLTISKLEGLIGLKIKTDNLYKSVEMKYLDQFIGDWIFGSIRTLRDLKMRLRLYGYNLKDNLDYKVAIVKSNNDMDSFSSDKDILLRFRMYESTIGTKTWMTIYEGNIVMIISLDDKDSQKQNEILNNIRMILNRITNIERLSLCISSSVDNPLNISQAFEEAKNVYASSCICDCSNKVITWEQLGIYAILSQIKPSTNVEKFMRKYMLPLKEYEDQKNMNLIETLEVYFKFGRSIKDTAKNMFVHYNTILYRIEKVKQILGMEFENPEELLELNIAIKLNKINLFSIDNYSL